MNNVILIGRTTKDPEIRYSTGNEPVAFGNYTLAVDRPSKKNDNETDFIFCKVLGSQAEFAEKYLRKGMKIAVTGRIQVDNFTDKEGNKRSTTYVQVLNHEFCESKNTSDGNNRPEPTTNSDGFMNIPDGIDEELPFQ